MMLRDDVRFNLRSQVQRVNYISVFPTHPRLVYGVSKVPLIGVLSRGLRWGMNPRALRFDPRG